MPSGLRSWSWSKAPRFTRSPSQVRFEGNADHSPFSTVGGWLEKKKHGCGPWPWPQGTASYVRYQVSTAQWHSCAIALPVLYSRQRLRTATSGVGHSRPQARHVLHKCTCLMYTFSCVAGGAVACALVRTESGYQLTDCPESASPTYGCSPIPTDSVSCTTTAWGRSMPACTGARTGALVEPAGCPDLASPVHGYPLPSSPSVWHKRVTRVGLSCMHQRTELRWRACRLSRARQSYTWLDWACVFLPMLRWVRTYKLRQYLLVRLAARRSPAGTCSCAQSLPVCYSACILCCGASVPRSGLARPPGISPALHPNKVAQ